MVVWQKNYCCNLRIKYKMKKLVILLLIGVIYSCDEIIEVTDISEETVTILAPTDATTVATGTINFNWNPVDEATEYQLQIATPTFENATQIVIDSLVTSNSFSQLLEIGEYQWRVKALNSTFETNFITNSLTVN